MTDKLTFFDVYNQIMGWEDLSLQTRVLWVCLCQMAWANGSCYPSTQTLSKRLQISLTTVKRSKAELARKNLVNVFHRGLPQTDLFFPFVPFKNIEQRDRNVTVLHSVSQTLSADKENNHLQAHSVSQTPTQCLTDTIHSVSQTPIKENIKRKDKNKEDDTTNVVSCQTCPEADISDTAIPPVKTKLTKKEKSELHHKDRNAQITEIEANLQKYQDEYPNINIDLQFRKMKLWLDTNQKGKVRKNITRTWLNWILKAQSNYNVGQLGKITPESKKQSAYEEFKKRVSKNPS